MTPLRALQGIPFFAPVREEDRVRIAEQGETLDSPAGGVIIREGEVGDKMYVILDGAVQVFTTSFDGSDIVLARLEAGRWFGEQALIPGGTGRRNASIRA